MLVAALVGRPPGPSSWVKVDQARIDAFAQATGDDQWIHTDPERAKDGPFGATIAHGYLTLALLIPMWSEFPDVREARTKVNYGLDRVASPHRCRPARLPLLPLRPRHTPSATVAGG